MVYIQAFRGSNKHADGSRSKEYWRHFVVMPKALVDALGWKKGDEGVFKLENGKIILKKKG